MSIGAKLSNLEMYILSALIARDQYGLEIIDTVSKQTDVSLSLGSLYTTLHRMEKKGLVKSRWGDSTEERAGARRRYYKITGMGQRTLINTKAAFTNMWKAIPLLET